MRSHQIMLGIVLGGIAAIGMAQEPASSSTLHEDQVLEGPFPRLPASMFGIECREAFLDGVSGSASCWNQGKLPIVSVYTYALGRELSYEDLVARMHLNFGDVGAVQVIDQGQFDIPSAPSATTMRGIYQTEKAARKFTWSVAFKGNFTRVMVSVADDAKIEDFEDEVMAKVFGPDRYVPETSTAP